MNAATVVATDVAPEPVASADQAVDEGQSLEDDRAYVWELVRARGLYGVAKTLGVNRETLARFAGALPVRAGTDLHVRVAIGVYRARLEGEGRARGSPPSNSAGDQAEVPSGARAARTDGEVRR